MATATVLREFVNASFTGTPDRCQVGAEQACCFLSRPAGGGPICMLAFVAGDGRDLVPVIDLRAVIPEFGDAFGASPFVSGVDGSLKAFLNFKTPDGGNNRRLAVVSTGHVPEVTR
jgi:hypothetical protein